MKKTVFLALLFVPAYLALALWMPETYRAKQDDSFFLFTADYFHSKLALQPVLTTWLTSLLLQFFRWPIVAGMIQGILSWLTAICLRLSLKDGWVGYLSLVPSLCLFLVWPFSLSLQLQVLAMAGCLLVYCHLPRWWSRLAWAVLLLPLGYAMLNMPLLLALFLVLALAEWLKFSNGRVRAVVVALFALVSLILPPIYSQQVVFIPFAERYSHVTEGTPQPLWEKELHQQDVYCQVLRAVEEERWADVRTIIRSNRQGRVKLMRNYLLLAESALGTLPDNLFTYTVNDPEDMLYRHIRDRYACQFNRLFYRNLGLWDECFHQAQEYFLLQPDACCFSSLTQMVDYSIREGEYAVAEKYLAILSHAPFYSSFVREQRERIVRQKAEKTIERPLRADNFVGGYPFNSEMVRLVEFTDGERLRIFDYLLCGLLLQKNLPHFEAIFRGFPYRQHSPLPEPYAQALHLIQTNGQISDEDCIPGSYYYFFRYVDIPEPNQRMLQSSGH